MKMNESLTILRQRAAHCRRLANLLFDERVARELSSLAADLDAEAERLEAQARPLLQQGHAA